MSVVPPIVLFGNVFYRKQNSQLVIKTQWTVRQAATKWDYEFW